MAMYEDLSIKPSYPWRLAAFALMIACCGFTGWLLGHAVAVAGPILAHVAHAIEHLRDMPTAQEFMAAVRGS